MRSAFVETLCSLAEADERIFLLTGDLGFMALEPFQRRFPARFLNSGVAEQNMIGIASGLAQSGLIPFVYSIAPFAALRPFEFIRNGPVHHRLPVRIVGMGAGFDYGPAGPSHYGIEDVAVMRTLPGITVVIPADSPQTASALRETSSLPGPVYYSLGKSAAPPIPALEGRFELGRLQLLRRGPDLAILAMGSVSAEALAAADEMNREGVRASVAVLSNFYPDPDDAAAALLAHVPFAITVEAQSVSGGLGAFAATVIASRGLRCRLRVMGVHTPPDGTSGSPRDRLAKHGLTQAHIVAAARQALQGSVAC